MRHEKADFAERRKAFCEKIEKELPQQLFWAEFWHSEPFA